MVPYREWRWLVDNRLNKIRIKIGALRSEMLTLEATIRHQVNRDQDCGGASLRLMEMRQQLSALIREWTVMGGGERLPSIQTRLRERLR